MDTDDDEVTDDVIDEVTDEPFDPAESDDDGRVIVPSSNVGKFRRTGAGMVLNGVALGLAEVFEGSLHEDPPIVQEAPSEPVTPRPVDAYLDPDDPTKSSVVVRSWRFGEHADEGDDADD